MLKKKDYSFGLNDSGPPPRQSWRDALRARLPRGRPSVAQLTVFVNGCLMALGFYVTLTMLANDNYTERYGRLVNDNQKTVTDNI